MKESKITWDYQYLKKRGMEHYHQKKYKEAIQYFNLAITALGWQEAPREFPEIHKYLYRATLLRDAPQIDILIQKQHYEEAVKKLEILSRYFLDPWIFRRLREISKENTLRPFKNKQGLFGYKNDHGKEIISPIYKEVERCEEARAAVKIKDTFKIINRKGEIIINEEFDLVHGTVGGFTIVEKNGKYNLINPKGKLHIKKWYDFVSPHLKAGLRCVFDNDDGKWGYLNQKGEVEIPIIYETVMTYCDELAAVEKNGKFGFINPLGQVIIPFKYEHAGGFSEGVAAIMKNGVWGFIDVTTRFGVIPQYEETDSFSDGICGVKKNGKWGAINKKGEVVIDFLYDNIFPCRNGIAAVEIKGEYYFINRRGILLGDANYYFKEIWN